MIVANSSRQVRCGNGNIRTRSDGTYSQTGVSAVATQLFSGFRWRVTLVSESLPPRNAFSWAASSGPSFPTESLREHRNATPIDDVIRLLSAIEGGDPTAAERLLPIVYDELRRLAAQMLARETPGQTLQATALVHEAYIRLVGDDPAKPWDGRRHFFAAAAQAMRRVLIDRARNRRRQKRGGASRRVRINLDALIVDPPDDDLLALDDALEALGREDPSSAELVRLRAFAGLTLDEAAEVLHIGRRTADRYWAYAAPGCATALSKDSPTPPI